MWGNGYLKGATMGNLRCVSMVVAIIVAVLLCTGCAEVFCHLFAWDESSCLKKLRPVFRGETKEERSAAVGVGEALLVTATAHLAGDQGTNWRSDLEIHNLSEAPGVVDVLVFRHGADNSTPSGTTLNVGPGETVRLDDVLDTSFGVEGAAALVLVPSAGRIMATSRTYNLLGPGNELGLTAGATFGQYIPAVRFGEAIRHGEQGRLIQLSHSFSSSRGTRTNIGLVNATDADLTVRIELYNESGVQLGRVERVLMPYEYEQVNRIFERVTGDDVADGYAVLTSPTEGGAFFAYASVVDNLTGDPVAITAQQLPNVVPPGAGDAQYVVAAAHVAGVAGTNWRTDLELHCWGNEDAIVSVELLEHGADNSNPVSATVTVDAGDSERLEDVVASLFGVEGGVALRVTPTAGRVLVTSRTYNLLGPGNDLGLPAGATFGQLIPGVSLEQAIGVGEEGRLIQLSQSVEANSGFRTNLILVNATGAPVDAEVELFNDDGTSLGSFVRSLQPYEYRQLNRVFATVTGAAVRDGYAVLRTTTDGGRLFALASVVDNLTGDPVGMMAPAISPPELGDVVGVVDGALDALEWVGIEEAVDRARVLGVDGLLDTLVDIPDWVASRTDDGIVIDYGDGWIAPDGSLHEGAINVDTSALVADEAGLNGTMIIDNEGYLVGGEPPAVGPTEWTMALTRRADGSVAGTVNIAPLTATKDVGDLIGRIDVDTMICPLYPIGGFLRVEYEDVILTVNLSSSCDPAVEHTIEPTPGGGDVGDLLAVEWSFSGSSLVGTIESSSGEWSTLGGSGYPRLNCLAKSSAGVFYSVSMAATQAKKSLITIDPGSGAGSWVGDVFGLAEELYIGGLAFSPSGVLYAAVGESYGEAVDDLYAIDPNSGAATLVGPITGFDGVSALEFDDATGTLYGWNYPTGLMTINPTTAAGADVNPAVDGPNIASLVVLPDGRMVGGQHDLYEIDRSTGETTLIAEGVLSNVRGIEALDVR